MGKTNDEKSDSYSIIEEIESQLQEALNKRKQDVEKALEERIKREREEAQKKLEDLDREMTEEKEALSDFKETLSEFEMNKDELKKQIKQHLDKAIQYQTDIENITGKSLEELKKVRDLNQKLEEMQLETGEKLAALKKNLEEKFGIIAEVPESVEEGEDEINLDRELARLKKIKELLGSEDVGEDEEEDTGEGKTEEGEPGQELPEEVSEPEPQEESVKEADTEKTPDPEQKEEKETEETPEEEKVQAESEVSESEEPVTQETPEAGEDNKTDASFQAVFDKLESYRKGSCDGDSGEVSYFENNEKIILDGECLVSTLNSSFEETKKLFLKLSQTDSPKDQFYVKQEIIKLQEALRKSMLRSIRMCEKENCSLPDYSSEILNVDVMKNVLEMVSMQNWSNQNDFATFDKFVKSLADSFYSQITPPIEYIQSIIKQLEIEEK